MAKKTIPWNVGNGSITINYSGSGSGAVTITSSENNLYQQRQQVVTFSTVPGGTVTRSLLVKQAAKKPNFKTRDGLDIKTSDGKYFNVKS